MNELNQETQNLTSFVFPDQNKLKLNSGSGYEKDTASL